MLRAEVDRVVIDGLVTRIARVAELLPLGRAADADFDAARLLRPGTGAASRQGIGTRVGHGFLAFGFLLTSLCAFAARGLRASFVAWTSAGLPAPVSDRFSVVFGVCAG